MTLAVVLGAGFSKAIDDAFPTADELGELVRAQAPGACASAPSTFGGGLFERWLSRIAEPQPDLGEAANLENARDFQLVTEALHRVMVDLEAQAVRKPIPWWLLRLVGLLHAERATVVTFNYDTLVEAAAARAFDCRLQQTLSNYSVTGGVPPVTLHAGMFGPIDTPTFRILKLHGSVDTYWVPGDASGATVTRISDAMWTPDSGMAAIGSMLERSAPGRVPFIVPPASAKSALFSNPITRQLWRTAAQRLSASTRIAVIGYSAPLTDLVATAMVADAQHAAGAQIDIVNPDPGTVAKHLEAAGVPKTALRAAASSCVQYVDDLEREAAAKTAALLCTAGPRTSALAVTGTFGQVRPVVDLTLDGSDVYVQVDAPQPRQEGLDTTGLVQIGDLVDLLRSSGAEHLVVTVDGERACLIDQFQWPEHADAALHLLIPSATRPRSD